MLYRDYQVYKHKRFNPLTKEKEVEYFTRYSNGDKGLVTELIERNMRFVIRMASKYHKQNTMLNMEELISEGTLGLHRAITMFDVKSGTPFIYYAVHWINNYLRNYSKENCNCDTVDVSIEYEADIDEEDSNNLPYLEETNHVELKVQQNSACKHILKNLSEVERKIIEELYGFNGKVLSVRELAKELNVSPDRIRNMREHIIQKLRGDILESGNTEVFYELI